MNIDDMLHDMFHGWMGDLMRQAWDAAQAFMDEGLPDLSLLRFKPEPRWRQVWTGQPVLVWWGWRDGLTPVRLTRPPPGRGILR